MIKQTDADMASIPIISIPGTKSMKRNNLKWQHDCFNRLTQINVTFFMRLTLVSTDLSLLAWLFQYTYPCQQDCLNRRYDNLSMLTFTGMTTSYDFSRLNPVWVTFQQTYLCQQFWRTNWIPQQTWEPACWRCFDRSPWLWCWTPLQRPSQTQTSS